MKRLPKFEHIPVIILSIAILFSLMPVLPVQAGQESIQVYLEDQQLSFTCPPQIINGRVMVPMRPIFEAMGATLEWDGSTQTATAVKGSTTVVAQIGNTAATINGAAQILDAAPTAMNGNTLAPLRFVAEAFGYSVSWEGASQTAYISEKPFQETILTQVADTSQSQVGDIVYYGNYEQDNNANNGKEPIAWQVLAVEYGRMLLISQETLDCMPYNTSKTDVTWETCTLRQWLNNNFMNSAFTPEEQSTIVTTVVENSGTSSYGTEGGKDTQDKVFLLSVAEADNYFGNDTERQAKPTAYALVQGASAGDNIYYPQYLGRGPWLLRSHGRYSNEAAFVTYAGDIDAWGCFVSDHDVAVRPALWLER